MNITKKIILSGVGVMAVTTTMTCVFSCSKNNLNSDSNVELPSFFISGVDEFSKKHGVAEKISASMKKEGKFKTFKTKLITATGRVDDKSFNQSLREAMVLFSNQTQHKCFPLVAETAKDEELAEKYGNSLNESDTKVWVLSGFKQATFFNDWLAQGDNYDKFVKGGKIAVAVDWRAESYNSDGEITTPKLVELKNAGHLITLNFRPQESSYVLGWAAADYISEIYKDKAKVNTFGGGSSDGVTNFNNGFLQAIVDWNEENSERKVRFASGNKASPNKVNLASGFNSTTSAASTAIMEAKNSKAQILFPVAGSLIDGLLQQIRPEKERMIIAVDANYSLAKPNDVDQIFSSAEKNVGIALYQVLIALADNQILKSFLPDSELMNFEEGKTSVDVVGGYELDFVGQSANKHTDSEKRKKINGCIEKAYKRFYKDGKFNPKTPLSLWKDMAKNVSVKVSDSSKEKIDDNIVELNELVATINK